MNCPNCNDPTMHDGGTADVCLLEAVLCHFVSGTGELTAAQARALVERIDIDAFWDILEPALYAVLDGKCNRPEPVAFDVRVQQVLFG